MLEFLLATLTLIALASLATQSQLYTKPTQLLGYCIESFCNAPISLILSAEQLRADKE